MAAIVLEKLDDGLFRKLSELAKMRQISVEDQVVAVLEDVLGARGEDTLILRADAIAAMTPLDIVQTDSAVLVREDRDR